MSSTIEAGNELGDLKAMLNISGFQSRLLAQKTVPSWMEPGKRHRTPPPPPPPPTHLGVGGGTQFPMEPGAAPRCVAVGYWCSRWITNA